VAEPFVLVNNDLPFGELNGLRKYLDRVLDSALVSLRAFYHSDSGGFVHYLRPSEERTDSGEISKASTATCVAFLVETGRWPEGSGTTAVPTWTGGERRLVRNITASKDWTSAGLVSDNPFTVSFLLEALWYLNQLTTLTKSQVRVIHSKLQLLRCDVLTETGHPAKEPGSVAIQGYRPTAFLTQKALRVIKQWERVGYQYFDGLQDAARKWTWERLRGESVAIAAGAPDADPYELAYAVLTASLLEPIEEMTPHQRQDLRYALGQFFDQQNASGGWPRSRPLFMYPKLGNAYCYEYELLVQLLLDPQLAPFLLERLTELRRAALALDNSKVDLVEEVAVGDEQPIGWPSGHVWEPKSTESWSTASCFHFCDLLSRLVAESIRRAVFSDLDVDYRSPNRPSGASAFEGFLDSPIPVRNQSSRLVATVRSRFLEPLARETESVDLGRSFSSEVPTSAILFGPPGTSKTTLATVVAKYLGWPLLAIDPSHLTRNGLDKLHSEASRVFTMLEALQGVVVLLDEFDELVRERSTRTETMSRFITTAMLPRLSALSQRRRIVWLLATNHLESFDAAIRRPGRFDMVVPVMPPLADEKFRHFGLEEKLDKLGLRPVPPNLEKDAGALTFSEFGGVVPALRRARSQEGFARRLKDASDNCIMRSRPDANRDDRSQDSVEEQLRTQMGLVRIP